MLILNYTLGSVVLSLQKLINFLLGNVNWMNLLKIISLQFLLYLFKKVHDRIHYQMYRIP